MKNIKFFVGLFAIMLIVASCTTSRGVMDDYDYDDARSRQVGNRIYMQDPLYGTVILERDPYSGRYYDVTPNTRFGYGYGAPYGGYYRGGGGVYRNAPVIRGGTNRNYGGSGNVVKPQTPSREEIRQDRESTRRRVLGGN